MPPKIKLSEKELFSSALSLEKEKEFAEAVKIYESIITGNPLNIDAQNRLMVLYRKLKESGKEVRAITRAIKSYQEKIEADQKQWIRSNKKKAELSKQLASSLGILNRKGLPVYENEILSKWKIRLSLLKERIAKAKLKDGKVQKTKKQAK